MNNIIIYIHHSILYVLFLLILIITSCKKNKNIQESLAQQSGNTTIIGFGSPIILEDTTSVLLEDYFTYITDIDSVTSTNLNINLSHDKKELLVTLKVPTKPLSEIKIWVGKKVYSLLGKNSNKKKTRILFTLDEKYEKVTLKGEFNNWIPEPLFKKNNFYEKNFLLPPGDYQYKLIADGKEINDPDNPNTVSNGMGGTNSLLSVPKADQRKLPTLHTHKIENGQIYLKYKNLPNEIFAFWQNQRVEAKVFKDDNEIRINIPKESEHIASSFLRVWVYNKEGVSNDLLIPLQNKYPIQDPKSLNRDRLNSMIMYFTLIDRFNNGNTQNDAPIKNDRLLPIQNYMGGDLSGITKKIQDGYFKRLGINTLWLSPITQNPRKAWQEYPEPQRWYSGYHGYWPISSTKVDERFGTSEDLKALVKTAHENDMNVLLDYVCNHVHQDHSIYKAHPEWATQLDLPDGTKNIRIWDAQRLTTWFDTFLPTLDLSKPEVIDIQSDSAIYWIKEYNLDGFRHDATKHIPEAFWRTLTHKLKTEIMLPENRYIYQIGETYGSHELIKQYIGSGMVDSQFDFNLYFTARDAFIKDDIPISRAADALLASLDWYGHHHTMGNITGNHDQVRFNGLASGAVSYDEDHREAGFNRNVQIKDTKGYLTLSNYFAFVMTIPGIPTVLYGDEIGMVGAGDPDNRRMMRFANLTRFENRTRSITSQLAQLRRSRMSLMYGNLEILKADDHTLAYARSYFDETTITVINKGKERKINIPIPSHINIEGLEYQFNTAKGEIKDGNMEVIMPEESFDIWVN